MLGTCPLVVIHGGRDLWICGARRTDYPFGVSLSCWWHHDDDLGRWPSFCLPCPALPCPAQAGSRATDGSISPCSASSPWVSARLSNHEGSLGSGLRGRLAAGEEASRRVSGRSAGHAQTGGLEKASAPQRGAEPW